MHRRQACRLAAALPVGLAGQSFAPTSQKRSLLNAPGPKFRIWDWVWHDYTVDDDLDENDDGKTFRVFGVVIGMIFNPESHYKRGWLYYVTTRKPESLAQPWNVDSYWHESEMSLLNASKPMFGEFELVTEGNATTITNPTK